MSQKRSKTSSNETGSAPATVAVWSADNRQLGEVRLSPEVFGGPVNEHLLYEAVKQHRAGARRGTHMTKNRALVSGTGRKPWRQKGTGRARAGETRSPLWRHGGTVFGPQPRDYSYSVPKAARVAALRSALAQRAGQGALKVVESFPLAAAEGRPRFSRQLRALLRGLGVVGKAVLVDAAPSVPLALGGRNLPDVKVVSASHLSVYDVLDCGALVVSREALGQLEARLTPRA